MTNLLISLTIMSIILMFGAAAVPAGPEPNPELTSAAPPLLRSGDFAISLAEALGLGAVNDEVEAQSLLASRGIAPRSGWFSNYPVTPLVMGELRESVINSSESGRLAVTRNDALAAFDSLAMDLGLAVDPSGGQAYAEAPPPGSEPPPAEAPYGGPPPPFDNSYYGGEPPILAYYPPPPAYLGYYDWVPYPFFYTGIPFSGFFILHDFHRVHRHHHFHHKHHRKHYAYDGRSGRRLISNQRFDRELGQTVRVRPRTALRAERLAAAVGDRAPAAVAPSNSGQGSLSSFRDTSNAESSRDLRRAERLERANSVRGNAGEGRSFRGSELSRSETGRSRALNTLQERRGSNDFRSSGSSGRGDRSFRSPDSFRGRGDVARTPDSFRRGGDSFRSSDSFRGSGSFRSSDSFRGGGGDSFRSFRSSGGRGGSFRSFDSGGSSGFSGRGGGGFSRGGGGGGGRGGRR